MTAFGRFCFAAMIAVSCLATNGMAKAQTASEYLQFCNAFLNDSIQRGDDKMSVPLGDASNCWHFFIAFRELADMREASGPPPLGLCIPTEVRVSQLIRIFVMYANAHPEILHEEPAVMAWQAVWQHFNCNGQH